MKTPRKAITYRSTRRLIASYQNLVWGTASYSERHVTLPKYVAAQPKGTSSYISRDGVRRPEVRMTRRTYKTNGVREMTRRLIQMAA